MTLIFSSDILAEEEKFRTQSVDVFSVVDSSIGIIKDPNTKLTIVDLGSFYGIGGNGTIPDKIKFFRDNHLWTTINKETRISPSTSHSEWQIPQTFFFNELPGTYKLILITNNTETLTFEFMVKQITEESKENYLINNMNNNSIEENDERRFHSKMPPLKQIANGISSIDVICKEDLQLVFKNMDDNPACVKTTTVDKLIERGWAKL
ncbi:hypothetical protein C5F50_03445 [Nitrosopumilus ureiphilus]|uniref:Uncharacterized protein n=1 Tax=Nitrosopumilus ureiphilus TaxID=1470067 RepID=A0A7D5M4M1_9ARCH|nr:hypothetical protein C5F50_03445 [Nitrosopumilus ureiphilus]